MGDKNGKNEKKINDNIIKMKNESNEDNNNKVPLKVSETNPQINFKIFKIITNEASDNQFDNSCITFKSIDNILFLIYSNENYSIFCYNLINFQLVNEIKKAHSSFIVNFRHFYDKNNSRDLIISVSSGDNNIKLWQFCKWECLCDYRDINSRDYLFSACFLNHKNQLYVLSSNYTNNFIPEPIKVFDLKGKKISEIKNSRKAVFLIDTFYDEELLTDYIVTANDDVVISYNFNKNDIYFKYDYKKSYPKIIHFSLIVKKINNSVKIIESGWDGYIRIWEFHTGKLLNEIKLNDSYLNGVNLLDNKYILIGCRKALITFIDLDSLEIIKELAGHKDNVIDIKIVNHIKYGKCILSKGYGGEIIFWTSNKK